MKKIYLLCIVALSLALISCASLKPKTATETLNGTLGVIDEYYSYDTSTIGEDGKNFIIDTLHLLSVEKFAEYSIFDTNFKNCVVVKLEGSLDSVKNFLSNQAYVSSCDADGKVITNYSSGAGEKDDVIYCIFETENDISTQTNFAFGGFNPNKNKGEDVFVFDI